MTDGEEGGAAMFFRAWQSAGFQLRLMYGGVAVAALGLIALAVAMVLFRPVLEPMVRWVHPLLSVLFLQGRGAWRYETGFYWAYAGFAGFMGVVFAWLFVAAMASYRRMDRQADAYLQARMRPRQD
jgi:hypothetical protein